ncbi:hypothetical protein J2S41_001503 [Catenuloplanes atrovinosus]|uniref:Uncharacterized protein n=1 Tax=Catenuloplanes atrovinosus TaxID=137266 RepID=A0AAE4CAL6_9ACTN|nr:hypothetical protein [Catenuloplanes atrovinosus]
MSGLRREGLLLMSVPQRERVPQVAVLVLLRRRPRRSAGLTLIPPGPTRRNSAGLGDPRGARSDTGPHQTPSGRPEQSSLKSFTRLPADRCLGVPQLDPSGVGPGPMMPHE